MEQLGIDANLLAAQLVNFAIIVFVLTKILYKPMLKSLEERKKKIQEGLALTEKMRQEEEKIKEKEVKMLEDARKRAQTVIEDAQKQAKSIEKDATERARKQSDAIVAKAKDEAKKYREEMEETLQHEAVDLAVVMSKQLLESVMSERDQKKLIAQHIKEIQNIHVR